MQIQTKVLLTAVGQRKKSILNIAMCRREWVQHDEWGRRVWEKGLKQRYFHFLTLRKIMSSELKCGDFSKVVKSIAKLVSLR